MEERQFGRLLGAGRQCGEQRRQNHQAGHRVGSAENPLRAFQGLPERVCPGQERSAPAFQVDGQRDDAVVERQPAQRRLWCGGVGEQFGRCAGNGQEEVPDDCRRRTQGRSQPGAHDWHEPGQPSHHRDLYEDSDKRDGEEVDQHTGDRKTAEEPGVQRHHHSELNRELRHDEHAHGARQSVQSDATQRGIPGIDAYPREDQEPEAACQCEHVRDADQKSHVDECQCEQTGKPERCEGEGGARQHAQPPVHAGREQDQGQNSSVG